MEVILFVLKIILILLVYLALAVVLLTVRAEMGLRQASGGPVDAFAPGHLQVISPGSDRRNRPGAILSLRPQTSLGSQIGNTIRLSDQFVSRRHAILRWDGVDWWIEDLGSRNGSAVDDAPCLPHQPTFVPNGATLRLGDMIFKLLE